VLDKGAAHLAAKKADPSVMLGWRLAPDMFPLTRQVQLACDLAKNSIARLTEQEPPRFPDTEASFEELHARIARTVDYLRGVPSGALEGAETRDIKVPTRDRGTLEFKGLEFLQHWAIPNVFFHVTAAYLILRHNGVELGKRDFLGNAR
jgi:hypothetical protein